MPKSTKPYEKLPGLNALFGEEDEPALGSEKVVAIQKIHRTPEQVRRYFDPHGLESFAAEIKEDGIRSALWVRPLPGGESDEYELVAGEQRYRAAMMIGLEEVPVKVFNFTDDEAVEASLVENLQRRDLNPLEETEGIIKLLTMRLECTVAEVVALFNRKAYLDKNKAADNVVRDFDWDKWEVVKSVLEKAARLTTESFRKHRLPLLNLPEDILDALRQGRIEYTKAQAIAKLKDLEQRQELLEEAIAQELSLSQIKERIQSLKPLPEESLKTRFDSTYKQVKKSNAWDDPKKRKQLEKLLAQMESLLTD